MDYDSFCMVTLGSVAVPFTVPCFGESRIACHSGALASTHKQQEAFDDRAGHQGEGYAKICYTKNGTPERTRTSYLKIRNLALCPGELPGYMND